MRRMQRCPELPRSAWDEAAADSLAGWDQWHGPEVSETIDEERADVVERVRRLAKEPGASGFIAALHEALGDQPPARAAG